MNIRLSTQTLLGLVAISGTLVGPSKATGEFVENFDRVRVNRSFYTPDNDWKKFDSGDQAQPKENRAFTRLDGDKRYLSILATGHRTANGRVYQNVDLPVSESGNHKISIEIRPVTPESDPSSFRNVSLGLTASKDGQLDKAQRFSMGILMEKGQMVFNFHAGPRSSRLQSEPEQVQIQPHEWYRLEADLNVKTGVVTVTAYELKDQEAKQVWSASNDATHPWQPERFSQINLLVTRPGSQPSHSHSADFAHLAITP